jgi:predicted DNA-binding protein (MmcQ/YjbR family)
MGFAERVAAICAPLPGAEVSDPWGGGHNAWKIGGKMFASIGAVDPGVSVKCADVETAAMLIDAGIGTRAPYFHRSWIRLPEDVSDADLSHRILTSYDLIRSKLPKKIQAAWPEREA